MRAEPSAGIARLPTSADGDVDEPLSGAVLARHLNRGEQHVGHLPMPANRLQPIAGLVLRPRLIRSRAPAVVLAPSSTRGADGGAHRIRRSELRACVLPDPLLHQACLPVREVSGHGAQVEKRKTPPGGGGGTPLLARLEPYRPRYRAGIGTLEIASRGDGR